MPTCGRLLLRSRTPRRLPTSSRSRGGPGARERGPEAARAARRGGSNAGFCDDSLAVRDAREMDLLGVGVRYGRRLPWVLVEVTVMLPAGALVEVTGRNGAGKSSLLRVLAGVLAPGAGRVQGRPGVVGWAPERFPVAQPVRTGDYLAAQAQVRGLGARAGSAVRREVERLGLGRCCTSRSVTCPRAARRRSGWRRRCSRLRGCSCSTNPGPGSTRKPGRPSLRSCRRSCSAAGRSSSPTISSRSRRSRPTCAGTSRGARSALLRPQRPARPTKRRLVIEVELSESQAPEVLTDLRRRGLAPRVR